MKKETIPPSERKKKYRAARFLGSVLMLAALIISGIIFFNAFQADNPRARMIAQSSDDGGSPEPIHTTAPDGSKQPAAKYSFYEQLQKRSNEVQAENNQRHEAQERAQSSTGKNYRVQVGAFREKVQAEKMRQRMALRKLPTRIIQSGELHLVQVGPYASQTQAEEIEAQLNSDGIETVIKTFVNH